MTEQTKTVIKEKALSFLASLSLRGEFALAFLDLKRRIPSDIASIDTFSSYEKRTGTHLPKDAVGITLRLSGLNIILYDDRITSSGRRNWTLAHELGHILLCHNEQSKENEREADAFAAELLMPEAVIRYLDARESEPITPKEMTNYFAASLSACRRRRLNLPFEPEFRPTEREKELLKRLFETNII